MIKYRKHPLLESQDHPEVRELPPGTAVRHGPGCGLIYRQDTAVLMDLHQVCYCQVLTAIGLRPINKVEYMQLVQDQNRYGLFIDGMTREVCCRHDPGRVRKTVLTPREFGMVREYMLVGRPLRPRSTEVGRHCLSDVAAIKLFEKARSKVDIRIGRYRYRMFRLHRNPTDQSLKAFEFAPPESLAYCLVLPV